jgi:NAD(P)-dependent dehydrogenase (short-subunit alcohol dehydrogenase family)
VGNIIYDFSGKRALVTGATKGLGREIALAFAGAGCDIAATGRNQDELDSLAAEIVAKGRRCEILRADLASTDGTLRMAEHFLEVMKPLDILINNAGIALLESVVNLQAEHWDAVLNVNLRAPALISKVVANHMIANGEGVIVNVSSAAGVTALKEHAAYCASKYGLIGLSQVMAVELGPHNIRVNVVAPTVVMTEMGIQVWSDPAKSEPMLAKIPLNRFAQPANIADAVMFLASEEASMINGVVLCVDGGYTAQ